MKTCCIGLLAGALLLVSGCATQVDMTRMPGNGSNVCALHGCLMETKTLVNTGDVAARDPVFQDGMRTTFPHFLGPRWQPRNNPDGSTSVYVTDWVCPQCTAVWEQWWGSHPRR